jgi:hypothetical protein
MASSAGGCRKDHVGLGVREQATATTRRVDEDQLACLQHAERDRSPYSAPLRRVPVGTQFPWQKTDVKPQALREDRILQEIHASGGDIRRICDLFGLTVDAAVRYAATLGHSDLANDQASRARSIRTRGRPGAR